MPRKVNSVQRAWDVAPMLFVYGVVLFFIVAAMNLGDRVQSVDLSLPEEVTTTTTSVGGVEPANLGALEIDVASLRARPRSNEVIVTLEVANTTNSDVKFDASQVVLTAAGGTLLQAESAPKSPMAIDPALPQLAPLTFRLPPGTSGPFSLKYGGHLLFNGYSV